MASDDEDLDLDALRAAALKSCNIIENKSNLPKRSSIHINPRKVQVSNNAAPFNVFPKKIRGQNYERQNFRRPGRNKFRSQRNSNLVVLTQAEEPTIQASQVEMIRPQDKWGGTRSYEKKINKDCADKFKRYDNSESEEEVNSRTSTPPMDDLLSDDNIEAVEKLDENSFPNEDVLSSTKDEDIELNDNDLLNSEKFDSDEEFDGDCLKDELTNSSRENNDILDEQDTDDKDISKEQLELFNHKSDDDFLQIEEEEEQEERNHEHRKRADSETSALSLRAPSDYDDILDESGDEKNEEKLQTPRVRSRSPVMQRRAHDRVRNSPPYSDDGRKQRERDRRRGRHRKEKKSRSRSRSRRFPRENSIESKSIRSVKNSTANNSRDCSRSPGKFDQ
ncbi:DgyrCDS2120 [Dimorphilus gyrociliatus]|uniref:DgyrCDS2120 n=1 Tax=Dimorphilus gyrociliatus TaxID=2664684 RepID=A0A7I8VBA1_9ANNE|nr:DgyrCDS2120 [Dimorphilus gyrociliatus]